MPPDYDEHAGTVGESALDKASLAATSRSIRERIALAEAELERIKGTKKGLLDTIKEWAGLLALLISIFYGFAFDIFNKLVLEKRLEVSKIASEIAQTEIEYARNLSSIQNPTLADSLSSATAIRMHLYAYKFEKDHLNSLTELSVPEALAIIGAFQRANRSDYAAQLVDIYIKDRKLTDLEKATVEIQKAKSLFSPGPSQNITSARQVFMSLVNSMANGNTFPHLQYRARVTAEWGAMELNAGGDAKCGQHLIEKSIALYEQIESLSPGSSVKTSDFLKANYRGRPPAPNQPANGCPFQV
ncbi:hypothetical protein [Methylorubrum podarium]|jgi:hypothetical protein|uniref:hypothetical protein n=1 Tax=Methylorubrum podarium TaxID=200476 RepID=UPI001EE2A212|nr:hypothetical protein [Methylorubrum podarium]GJE72213.1 hypothetical protein CHKEEEPN_3767 [Methylorubrum podarium]